MEDRTVVAHGCRKTKKIICGMEGITVVAYGRMPSPAFKTLASNMKITLCLLKALNNIISTEYFFPSRLKLNNSVYREHVLLLCSQKNNTCFLWSLGFK